MKQVYIYSAGNLPAFAVSPTDPGYWTERLSYEISHTLNDMQSAGFCLEQKESIDFEALTDEMTDVSGQIVTFFNALINHEIADGARSLDDLQAAPDVLASIVSFLPLIISQGFNPGGLFVLFVAAGTGVLLNWLRQKFAKPGDQLESGGGAATEELVNVLKQAFLRSENVESAVSLLASQPDSINGLADVLRRALINVEGIGEDETIRGVFERLLEEWRVDFCDDKGTHVSFMSSQSVTDA